MYHTIEFRAHGLVELEMPSHARVVQVLMQVGVRVRAKVKPYVMESDHGPVEVADLFSEDGSVARAVRFAFFRFTDE
jgi:hypothetical protein